MQTESDRPHLNFVRECVLLGRKWRARVDERLKPEGLTLARATVLYWINAMDGVATQRELADIVGIEGPTLVRQLHALEEAGLVERIAIDGDRRAKGLRLTSAATPMLTMLDRIVDDMCDEFFGKLDRRRLSSGTKLARDARIALE